jgi:hypothetical protein
MISYSPVTVFRIKVLNHNPEETFDRILLKEQRNFQCYFTDGPGDSG